MEDVWLVLDHGDTIAVCDTETTADKVIERYLGKKLQKKKVLIVADVIANRFYYYRHH